MMQQNYILIMKQSGTFDFTAGFEDDGNIDQDLSSFFEQPPSVSKQAAKSHLVKRKSSKLLSSKQFFRIKRCKESIHELEQQLRINRTDTVLLVQSKSDQHAARRKTREKKEKVLKCRNAPFCLVEECLKNEPKRMEGMRINAAINSGVWASDEIKRGEREEQVRNLIDSLPRILADKTKLKSEMERKLSMTLMSAMRGKKERRDSKENEWSSYEGRERNKVKRESNYLCGVKHSSGAFFKLSPVIALQVRH